MNDERFRTWILLAFTIPALALACFVDWVFAGLVPAWLYAAYGLVWLLVLWPAAGRRPSGRNALILLSFATVLLALYIAPSKREVFLHDFHQISPGMTRPEVEAIMQSYRENMINPQSDRVIFRHSAVGSRSADHGVVVFQDHRVVSVAFLPD